MKAPVRVLVVDDSALIRRILREGLDADSRIEVVGTASDPYVARERIVRLNPDVITLDVEMPRMDGVEFVRRLMPNYPKPVIMVSSLTPEGGRITMDALEAGAVDFVTKPKANVARGVSGMIEDLRNKVVAVSHTDLSHWKTRKPSKPRPIANRVLTGSTDKIIVIGASTGGTEAICQILTLLPATCPGVLVIQHMPEGFTRRFAERLDREVAMTVKEAESGDRIIPGRILIAPGAKQTKVYRSGGQYLTNCAPGDKVNGHCPSVSVTFESAAQHVGANAIGVILTGMGGDGADGLLKLRQTGAHTIGQDERSCVVYGMPKVAKDLGAVEHELPLGDIADRLMHLVSQLD